MAGHLGGGSVYGLPSINHGQQSLPSGACGFRDLSGGSNSSGCGCKRFWVNSQHVPDQFGERAWCYCGHHACFHDFTAGDAAGTVRDVSSAPAEHIALQEQPMPRTPQGYMHMSDAIARRHARPWTTGLGIQNASHAPSQSINTRLWQALNGFARNQDDDKASYTTSKLPSTRVPSVAGEPRASPARVIQAQQQYRAMGPPISIPANPVVERHVDDYSATEVATPSIRGTPDLRASTAPPQMSSFSGCSARADVHQSVEPRPSNSSHQSQAISPLQAYDASGNRMSRQEMENTIQDFGRRISVLESMSFDHMPSGEVQDKFDLVDGRLIDLELWRTDLDKQRHSSEPEVLGKGRRRTLSPTDSVSSASDESFDSNAAAQTEAVVLATLAASAELRPRIDGLESRIADLEDSTMPSFVRPWHVQVVVLPFGRHLPGIWFSSTESTQQSQRSAQPSEDWHGVGSTAKSSFKSTASGTWTTESIQAWANETQDEWLLPKACGPGGAVFQRLESRGLVQDIIITTSDARHIARTISAAFANLLHHDKDTPAMAEKGFRGLQENLIPLRKVRKSTRLRFLSPSEMVTPALWTAGFLETSVFMKVDDGQRRLYMTTPDAYVQNSGPGWSWPMIKYLPLPDVDGVIQAARDDGTIIEACWTYNQRLDTVPSLDSSFDDRESLWSIASQHQAQHDVERDEMLRSPDLVFQRLRSSSLPSAAAAPSHEPPSKRRVASYETISTVPEQVSSGYFSKRRRVSDLPGVEHGGVNYTPRWSREPPSPYAHDDPGRPRSQTGKRGITPTAYATPHSHFDSSRAGDAGTGADTEIHVIYSSHDEDIEEWEGVQDGPDSQSAAQAVEPSSSVYDEEVDDDDENIN